MRILDRERYWAFIKAYIICFVALVGLYVVIDAFSNLDEFGKRADGPVQLFQVMGWYYLIHMSQFYDRLCGVIGMMAAIFTVTWMQKNNELLAMLAAGVSTLPRHPSGLDLDDRGELDCGIQSRSHHAKVCGRDSTLARRRWDAQSPGPKSIRQQQGGDPRP